MDLAELIAYLQSFCVSLNRCLQYIKTLYKTISLENHIYDIRMYSLILHNGRFTFIPT